MKGIPLHPLRLAALDRMSVLRVPFREQPMSVCPQTHKAIPYCGPDGLLIERIKPPYAPGEYFVREAWAYGGNPYLYKIDDPTASKKWFPARSMKEIQSRYLVTLGPPVPCRLGEVGMKEAIAEGWDGNIHCDYYDEWHMKTWNTLYPKHPYSPDRWTWGYPMEVRRR